MLSSSYSPGPDPRAALARTSDGAVASFLHHQRMAHSPDAPHPDGEQAIRILSNELGLTYRQAEVLHWVAKGKTSDEIAAILECSFHTVKTHLKDVFQRLGVNNRAGAIGTAYSMFYELLRARTASPERGIPRKRPSR